MKNMMLMASAAAFHLKLNKKIWLLATLFLLNKQQDHSRLTSGLNI